MSMGFLREIYCLEASPKNQVSKLLQTVPRRTCSFYFTKYIFDHYSPAPSIAVHSTFTRCLCSIFLLVWGAMQLNTMIIGRSMLKTTWWCCFRHEESGNNYWQRINHLMRVFPKQRASTLRFISKSFNQS